jgi:ABC-type Fe3+/spermidine/putrescine transport system ATPase subunit
MIRVENLERKFGDFSLSIKNFEIPKNKYGVILGPSGSGKSLFLKLICGLYGCDQGRISIAEEDVTEQAIEKRNIGLVFQEPSLFPHYSVEQNINYGLKLAKVEKEQRTQIFSDLTNTLQLENIIDRPVLSLSGGEAQKVVLARALAVRPRVLLLDEPLSQVDHHARRQLQTELKKVHHKFGLTCLHVTHDRQEALEMADVCAVMLAGKIIQYGPLEELQKKPRCSFVARFLDLDQHPVKPTGCMESCILASGRCDILSVKEENQNGQ